MHGKASVVRSLDLQVDGQAERIRLSSRSECHGIVQFHLSQHHKHPFSCQCSVRAQYRPAPLQGQPCGTQCHRGLLITSSQSANKPPVSLNPSAISRVMPTQVIIDPTSILCVYPAFPALCHTEVSCKEKSRHTAHRLFDCDHLRPWRRQACERAGSVQ